MKVGFYGNVNDVTAQWLSRISEIENIPLLKIDINKKIEQIPDYLIAGGAPTNMINYWEGLKKLSRKLPKTTFLIQELYYCKNEEIKERMGKNSKLEILEMDSFSDKVNELIDKAK